jgi:hypothetical protein
VVNIYEGTQRDAILHAVGANANHGLRRTNADKIKAVLTLLKDSEWRQWSDTEIAKKCRVSQPFVSNKRKELTNNGYEWSSTRKCADGRIMETSNIGAKTNSEGFENSISDDQSELPQSRLKAIDKNEDVQTKASEGVENVALPDSKLEEEESDKISSAACNNGSDINNTTEADESTSIDYEDQASISDENLEGQDSQEEGKPKETQDGNLAFARDNEDSEIDNDSPDGELDESREVSFEAPETDDVQTLKSEIVECKKIIIKKDKRIAELEKELSILKDDVKFYEAEILESLNISEQEKKGLNNRKVHQPLLAL